MRKTATPLPSRLPWPRAPKKHRKATQPWPCRLPSDSGIRAVRVNSADNPPLPRLRLDQRRDALDASLALDFHLHFYGHPNGVGLGVRSWLAHFDDTEKLDLIPF